MENGNVMIETNNKNAYRKYSQLVVDGLKKQSGERLASIKKSGGQFFILRGTDDVPYFIAVSDH